MSSQLPSVPSTVISRLRCDYTIPLLHKTNRQLPAYTKRFSIILSRGNLGVVFFLGSIGRARGLLFLQKRHVIRPRFFFFVLNRNIGWECELWLYVVVSVFVMHMHLYGLLRPSTKLRNRGRVCLDFNIQSGSQRRSPPPSLAFS